jgi:hypothetical protein
MPFGFADIYVAQPTVVRAPEGYRMYFSAAFGNVLKPSAGIGVATSTDGLTFRPNAQPVVDTTDQKGVSSLSVFQNAAGWELVLGLGERIVRSNSTDGLTFPKPFTGLFSPTECGYCGMTVQFPFVMPDFSSPDRAPDGGGGAWLMFFSAVGASFRGGVSIGRASSADDGMTFQPEPAPLLSSDLTGEAFLAAPKVVLDGTVYKMWYSLARLNELAGLDKPCDPLTKTSIGYATSSDGFYWIRSPSNPVMEATTGGAWDNDAHTLLVGSVLPKDGMSADSGFTIYYTAMMHVGLACVPFIGRAARP